jgi:major capsid protein gp7
MAGSTTNVFPNLVDWARRADPDGAIAVIAEMLSQCNEILKDMIWQEGNLPLGHKTTVRVGLPQGVWRAANQGVPSSKSLTAQFQDSIGELQDYSIVDKSLATLNGNVAKFRYSEDMAHVEGLSQQIASGLFYLNEATTPTAFTGFGPRYNTITTTNAKNAVNVLSGGGSASANLSIWLVGWGDNTIFGIFPKGSQAGLVYEDKGDVVPAYDSNGNRFEAYTSLFQHKIGLCVKDWRFGVRIANVDTTTAGLQGSSPPDLFALMSRAVVRLPTASRRLSGITESDAPDDPVPGISPAWYVNRTGREYMDIQAIRDKNVLLSSKDYAGDPVMMFRDCPIRVVDALTNTEVALT